MCPLIMELQARGKYNLKVAVTGQHKSILTSVLSEFGIVPDIDLKVGKIGQSLSGLTAEVIMGMDAVIESLQPDFLLVHGDTTSALASALSAFYHSVKVAHVESGLRTYNPFLPFPEEFNRRAIDAISSLHLAPTEIARDALIREGIDSRGIFTVGNTVIDALSMMLDSEFSHPVLEWSKGNRLIILTAHRRENWGEPIKSVFSAAKRLVRAYPDLRIILPVHPNPEVIRIAKSELSAENSVYLTSPLSVKEFHNILARSYAVITDSGGIQEEASFLGKPLFITRSHTERSEIFRFGGARLVGCDADEIFTAVSAVLDSEEKYRVMATPARIFGDGTASQKIADIFDAYFERTSE